MTSTGYPTSNPSTTAISAKTHTNSPISTKHKNSKLTICSGLILNNFGPSVQTIFDCISSRGELTYNSLLSFLTLTLSKQTNSDRQQVIAATRLTRLATLPSLSGLRNMSSLDSEANGYVIAETSIKGALLVLITHGLVTVEDKRASPTARAKYMYTTNLARTMKLARYSKYIKHVETTFGATEALVVKLLLTKGILRSENVVMEAVKSLEETRGDLDEVEGCVKPDRDAILSTYKKECFKAFQTLTSSFVVVKRHPLLYDEGDQADEGGGKRRKTGDGGSSNIEPDDSEVKNLIKESETKVTPGAVWEVSTELLDKRLKSCMIGKFVKERVDFESKKGEDAKKGEVNVDQVVASALWSVAGAQAAILASNRKQAFENRVHYVQVGDGLGGQKDRPISADMAAAVIGKDMSIGRHEIKQGMNSLAETEVNPKMVSKAGDKSWTIEYNTILRLVKDRMVDDLIRTRWSATTARVFATLRRSGDLLDSVAISTIAMIPEKDCREALNELMLHKLCVWHDLPISKQFAYNSNVYLWGLDEARCNMSLRDMLRTAYINVSDRRRVYMNSDKAAVFERLKSKVNQNFVASKGDSGGNSEKDKAEEKDAIKNLDILDSMLQDLDNDMLFFSEENAWVRTFEQIGYGGDYFGEVPIKFRA